MTRKKKLKARNEFHYSYKNIFGNHSGLVILVGYNSLINTFC